VALDAVKIDSYSVYCLILYQWHSELCHIEDPKNPVFQVTADLFNRIAERLQLLYTVYRDACIVLYTALLNCVNVNTLTMCVKEHGICVKFCIDDYKTYQLLHINRTIVI
jgi:hypothetical protein